MQSGAREWLLSYQPLAGLLASGILTRACGPSALGRIYSTLERYMQKSTLQISLSKNNEKVKVLLDGYLADQPFELEPALLGATITDVHVSPDGQEVELTILRPNS